MRDSQRTVAVILEAAERVIVQSGVEKATIDEVAREAGVSKGGVLHHFPSKEAIILGLVGMLIEKFEADVAARQALDPEPNGSYTRAFLDAVTASENQCSEVFMALQGAFRSIPSLQQLKRDASLRRQARIEQDGIDPVCATIVRFAAEGLWMARLHNVSVPSEPLRSAVIDHLVALTQPGVKEHAPALIRRTRQGPRSI